MNDIRRPEVTPETGNGIRRPGRRLVEDRRTVRPMNQVRRRLGADARPGAENVISVAVLDDGGRVVNESLTLQRQRLEFYVGAAGGEGREQNHNNPRPRRRKQFADVPWRFGLFAHQDFKFNLATD